VLFPYTIALLHRITSLSLVPITKWLAIISGAVLCLTIYFLSLEIFDDRTPAIISAYLIAVSRIQLIGYMNYYPQIMAMSILPVSLVFLIRYMKYNKLKYIIIASIFSSLIVLASYLTAFVFFIIVTISIVIYGALNKNFKALLIIPTTALILTFFWLPMVWRHGIITFIKTFAFRILNTPSAFTNQPWSLMNYLTFSGSTIVAIIAGVIAISIIRKLRWDYPRLLLIIWLIITFALMQSYHIKAILWVDRYFQFFDIALMLSAGRFISIIMNKLNSINKVKYIGYALLIVMLAYPLYTAMNINYVFGRWGYASDMAMLEYMQHLPQDSLVVAPPGIHSFWVSALSGVKVLDGESSQMMEHRYLGDRDSDIIINSPDVDQKMNLIRKYGVNYIFVSLHKPLYMVWHANLNPKGIEAFNNSTYFEVEKVFRDAYGVTVLIKVREQLRPNYNIEIINWRVTMAGYAISIITILVLVYIIRREKL